MSSTRAGRGACLPAVPIGEPGLVMEPQSLEALLNRLDARCAHVCRSLSASRKFAAVQRNRCNVRAPSALRRANRGPSRQNRMNNHVVAMPTRSPHATRRANSSGSTLPPDSTTTAVFPATSSLPASSAASATAPPGSTTSLSSRNAKATARATSSSLAVTPSPTRVRLISKVSCRAIAPSGRRRWCR